MWPAHVTGLAGQAPRRRCAAVGADGQAHAGTVVQGQPGIEPGRTLAVAAGLLACASKHNGLLRKARPVVRCAHLVGVPLRLRLRALRVCTTPVMSCAPSPLHAAPACARAAPNTKACVGHGCAIATGDHSQALARGLEGWPRPSAIRPRGAPQRFAITTSHQQKGEDHHARANHHRHQS
jgi:hypothetical protein